MRTALPVIFFLAAASCQSTGTGVPCRPGGTECGQGATCLQIGTCAQSCSASTNSCIAGEKCSTSGGCVPSTGCGADSDCGSNKLCQLGQCGTPCAANGCGSGAMCMGDGHCMLVPPGGGTGGGMSCGGELFQSTHVQANFLIVLDHSGSMMETINGVSKWKLATDAVKSVTNQYQSQIRFGLSMFSSPTQCDPGKNYVPVGDLTAMSISGMLPAVADGKGTPIGGALHVAQSHAGLIDPSRANFVLVVTDGKENCQGDPVKEVTTLASMNIKTYVVGFGADVDKTMLANMAISGGTARNTTPRYYQADDQTGLSAAFATIAAGAIGCDFRLATVPPNLADISVYVNGQLIPRDTTRRVGWDYNNSTGDRLTLYGTTCDAVASDPNAKVQIIYGCPGGLVEGVPDGGGGHPPILTDAGITIN